MSKNEKYEKAVKSDGHKKMVMIEKAMHGNSAGKRESKNYRGKDCGCGRKK